MSWFWDWYEEQHMDDENYPSMEFEKTPNKKSSRIRRREFVKKLAMKTIKERAAMYVETYAATNYETYAEKDDIALAYEAGANEIISIFNKMIESSESLENIKNVICGLSRT